MPWPCVSLSSTLSANRVKVRGAWKSLLTIANLVQTAGWSPVDNFVRVDVEPGQREDDGHLKKDEQDYQESVQTLHDLVAFTWKLGIRKKGFSLSWFRIKPNPKALLHQFESIRRRKTCWEGQAPYRGKHVRIYPSAYQHTGLIALLVSPATLVEQENQT